MLEALRQRVTTNPDDVKTLAVYADALLELGDPLGEVVRASAEHPFPRLANESELFIAGQLASSVEEVTIEGALMTEVTLRRLTPRGYARATGREVWNSVRSLHFARGPRSPTLPTEQVVCLVRDPVMASLREVTGFELPALAELGRHSKPLAIEAIQVLCHAADHFPQEPLPALAKVERLTFSDCTLLHLEEFMTSRLMPQIRVIEIETTASLGSQLGFIVLENAGDSVILIRDQGFQAIREVDGWHLVIRSNNWHAIYSLRVLAQHQATIRSVSIETPELSDEVRDSFRQLAADKRWQLQVIECLKGGPVEFPANDEDAPF